MPDNEQPGQINAIMEKRTILYDWMRQIFIAEPSLAFIQDMAETGKLIPVSGLSKEEALFVRFFQTLEIKDCPSLHSEIKAEYARLFIGPKHKLAPPYESVYRSASKTLFEESTLQIRECYEEAGLQVKRLYSEPDDHIGFELEYLYYMAFKTYEATLKNDNAKIAIELINKQLSFLEQHLAMWITPFTNDIITQTNLEFFKVSAQFLNFYITEDRELLRDYLANLG